MENQKKWYNYITSNQFKEKYNNYNIFNIDETPLCNGGWKIYSREKIIEAYGKELSFWIIETKKIKNEGKNDLIKYSQSNIFKCYDKIIKNSEFDHILKGKIFNKVNVLLNQNGYDEMYFNF
tara:strand:+ start:42 stop:407 length:366 start_codon:yes stop_codon:yes gene_type:complete